MFGSTLLRSKVKCDGEREISQQITEGSTNFRLEIEGYLNSAELTFGEMNTDLRTAMSQAAQKFNESDEKNTQIEGVLRMLIEQQKQTQQAWENERKARKQENEDVSKKGPRRYSMLWKNNSICLPLTNRR